MSSWVNIKQHGAPKEGHTVIDAFVDGQIEHALYYGGRTFYTREGRPIASKKVTHYRLVDNSPPEDIGGSVLDLKVNSILEDSERKIMP